MFYRTNKGFAYQCYPSILAIYPRAPIRENQFDFDKTYKFEPVSILNSGPIANPLDKLPAILKKSLDKNLCVCNEVPKIDIINAIANGATTVAEVRKQTYATMGSGCCKQQVERLIECLCLQETDK